MVNLKLKAYIEQNNQWPQQGRVILCQQTCTPIVVYQSYKPCIGHYALKHQKFERCPYLSVTRMFWIKTSFLRMMYRNGWATKKDQEVVLAIHIDKNAFNDILKNAATSSFKTHLYISKDEYRKTKLASQVRLQRDPEHDLLGNSVVRRAIRLETRGEFLRRFASGHIIESIEDITEFI